MSKFPPTPIQFLATMAVAALCAIGCAKSREGLISQVDEPHLTEGEVYWRVIDQSPIFIHAVEQTADSIIASSTDPDVRRNALT